MKKQLKATEGVFIITIIITLLVCQGLYAAEETLPTPEEIVAKNIEAIGGIKALKKIKNKKIIRTIKNIPLNKESKNTSYQERPSKSIGISDGGKCGSDGRIAWEIFPSGVRLLEGDQLSNTLIGDLFDGPDGPDARYKSMKTEGIEQINGKDCYKVVKIQERGPERTVYYDKNSYMIVKIMGDYSNSERKILFENYFEYQKIGGIFFPYKEVTFLNGQKVNESTMKIELNIEMPEGIFDIPEEIKEIMNKKQL